MNPMHPMLPRFLGAPTLLAIACWAVPLGAQQTWKVSCLGGHGVDFTDLPPAVAAAQPGDTILVWSGSQTCGIYNAPTIDKPLNIVGFWVPATPGGQAALRGVLTVTGIPAGQRVLINNLSCLSINSVPLLPSGFRIQDCAGEVVLDDCLFNSMGCSGMIAHIENSANVVLRGTEVVVGSSPMRVLGSTVLLNNVLMYCLPPAPQGWPMYGYLTTTDSLFVQNSTVTMADSFVWGMGEWNGQPRRYAAVVQSGTLRVGAGSNLVGGWSSLSGYLGAYWINLANPPFGAVQRDPSAGFLFDPDPSDPRTPIPITSHGWITAGESYIMRVKGEPGSFALLCLADMQSPAPTPFGASWLDPATLQLVDLVALPPPYGSYGWSFQCPSSAPNGHAFVYQSLVLTPGGTLSLTVPSPVLVGWRTGQIP